MGAQPIGAGEPRGARLEQILVCKARGLKKPRLESGLRFESAVEMNVTQLYTFLGKRAADEKRAMAIQGIALGANERDRPARSLFADAPQSGGKGRLPCHPLVVARGIARPAAKLSTEKKIGNASSFERTSEGPARELRLKARGRYRAHIGDACHAMLLQQADKALNRMIGMADGIDGTSFSSGDAKLG